MVRGGATEYQAYRAKLASLLPALQAALKPGGTYILRVAHDDWCPFLRGGHCVCDPTFSAEEVSGR